MTLDLCRFLSLRLNKRLIFLVCHTEDDRHESLIRKRIQFVFKTLADNDNYNDSDNGNDNDDDNSIRAMQSKHNPV